MTSTLNFPKQLRVRVIESVDKIKLPKSLWQLHQGLLSCFIGCWKLNIPCSCLVYQELFCLFLDFDYPVMLSIPSTVEFSIYRRNFDNYCNDANRPFRNDGGTDSIHHGQAS